MKAKPKRQKNTGPDKNAVAFIGAGNMASAIIKCLCASGTGLKISACDTNRSRLNNICKKYRRVKKLKSNREAALRASKIVIAVKPADIEAALEPLKGAITKRHLVISIAAGVTIKRVRSIIGANARVIRVMPNTPALVGEGACGYSAGRNVSAASLSFAEKFMNSFCSVVFKLPEKQLNAVTAVSGSGPAYFFYVAEAVAEAASKMNLNRKKAEKLIAATMAGSGRLMLETGEAPGLLRKKVTSKGGTTAAAAKVLDKSNTGRAFSEAVLAAEKRAREMGG